MPLIRVDDDPESMTSILLDADEKDPMTITTAPTRSGWAAYGHAWKRTPGRALYLLLVFVLAMTALSVLAGLFWSGVGLLILIVGLPIVVLSLLVARGFGVADRYLLSLTGLPEIGEPEWSSVGDSRGFSSTLTRPLRNGHYWIYLLHGMIVSPILSTVTFALTTVWLSVSLGGLTYWFWGSFIPRGDGGEWGQYVAAALPWLFEGWSSWAVEVVLYLVGGHRLRDHTALGDGRPRAIPPCDRARDARALAQRRARHGGAGRSERPQRGRPGRERRAAAAGARHPRRPAAAPRAPAAGPRRPRAASRRGRRRMRRPDSPARRRCTPKPRSTSCVRCRLASRHRCCRIAASLPRSPPWPREARCRCRSTSIRPSTRPYPGGRPNGVLRRRRAAHECRQALGASAATLKASLRPGAMPSRCWTSGWSTTVAGERHLSPGHGLEGLRDRVAGLRGVLVVDSPIGGPTTIGVHIPLATTIRSPLRETRCERPLF